MTDGSTIFFFGALAFWGIVAFWNWVGHQFVTCPSCQLVVPKWKKACQFCGHSLSEDAASESAAPEEAAASKTKRRKTGQLRK